ncbi:MAG: uncharacterized protein KVP18_001883 [Porospora cf. gigantea A]|uniref:uncharacterized protein n=2 Tax=Porospora cf. gigantea A TaxID=2853593 RepID=UPI00355A206E|nr:MAG: hypothetical protein KVP18_001883 [Porospora cf. gigantea A]
MASQDDEVDFGDDGPVLEVYGVLNVLDVTGGLPMEERLESMGLMQPSARRLQERKVTTKQRPPPETKSDIEARKLREAERSERMARKRSNDAQISRERQSLESMRSFDVISRQSSIFDRVPSRVDSGLKRIRTQEEFESLEGSVFLLSPPSKTASPTAKAILQHKTPSLESNVIIQGAGEF